MCPKIRYLWLFWFFSFSACFAQNLEDSLLATARAYVKQEAYQEAFKHYLLALPQYQKNKDNLVQSNIYKEMGLLCSHWQIDEKAAEYYQKSYQTGKQTALNTPENQQFWLENIAKAHQKMQQRDSALYYYGQLLGLIRRQDARSPALPAALYQVANLHMEMGNYEKALPANAEILAFYQQAGDKNNEAIALNNVGFNHKFLKNYAQSIDAFERSLALQEAIGARASEHYAVTLLNLGVLHQNTHDYERAKSYLLACQKIAEQKNLPAQQAEIYSLLGAVYFLENDLENALEHSQKAAQLAQQAQDLPTLQASYLVLSQTHQALKEDKTALAYYKKYKETTDAILQKELRKDEELLRRKSLSTHLENDLKLRAIEKEILELDVKNIRLESDKKNKEYEILLKNNQLENANLKQRETENARREAESAREVQALLIAKQKSEAEKGRQENELLAHKNQLQSLALKQKELEKSEKQRALELKDKQLMAQKAQTEAQRAQAETQKARARSYYIGFVLLSVLIVLALAAFLQKQRDNRKIALKNTQLHQAISELNSAQATIEEQNADLLQRQEELESTLELVEVQKREIEERNDTLTHTLDLVGEQKKAIERAHEDIHASIGYALRIQQAMLPHLSYIKQFLPEIFILFKPRDIVSGDFYWFSRQGGYTFLILGDCTGHGVPGAFMTMMGAGALSHIVNEDEIYEPFEIVKELDERIIERVQTQSGSYKIDDGMDLVMLRFEEGGVTFCASRRPMLYVQAGELKEIKGARMPVGGSGFGQKSFTQEFIPTQAGDIFYLFSDGYVDQFNADGNKFRMSQLRELVAQIHAEPMDAQHDLLEQRFEEWRGQERRVDDVSVIGVRIT